MADPKCRRCYRLSACMLAQMAGAALPVVDDVLRGSGRLASDWEKRHRLLRALRIYTEDWIYLHALHDEDVEALADRLLAMGEVDAAALVDPCRQYQGA